MGEGKHASHAQEEGAKMSWLPLDRKDRFDHTQSSAHYLVALKTILSGEANSPILVCSLRRSLWYFG